MEKKIKKVLTIITLISIAIPILMLISAIFGMKIFEGLGLQVLLSFATIAIVGAFSINALNIYYKKRNLSIISLSLLGLSIVLSLIIYWSNFTTPEIFNNITIVIAMATILFSIIVSMHIKLGKKYLALQSITYICIILIDLFLTINIFFVNLFEINGLWQTFIIAALVTFALLCTTGILSKKANDNDETIDNTKYIKITQNEYNNLKQRIKELENELKSLKK